MPHHDLIVVGTGSGNRVIDDSFADLDVAIVEEEQRFGGTCVNVGCIPSKMLSHAGEVVDTTADAAGSGCAHPSRAWTGPRSAAGCRAGSTPSPATDGRAASTRPGSPSTPDTRGSAAPARSRSTGLTRPR